jgi:hypothetical protein
LISFDLAYELTLGAVCAALRRRPSAPVSFAEPAFREGLLVATALYVPSAIAALVLAPAWQTMYLLDFDPTWGGLALVGGVQTVGLVGLYVAGFVLAARAIAAGRGRLFAIVSGVAWVALLTEILGVRWRAAFTVTTFEEFHSHRRAFDLAWGAPNALLGSRLLALLVGAAVANIVAVVWLTRHLRAVPSPAAEPTAP